MTADRDLERSLAELYASEGGLRAPDRVLLSALETIDTTRQRRAPLRLPRRFPTMTTYARVAVAGMIVIAVGTFGLLALRPSTGTVTGPGSSPSASPDRTASPAPPPTQPFTSAIHGLSVGPPAAWSIAAATQPWAGGPASFADPTGDVLFDPTLTDHLFLALRSRSIGNAEPARWIADGLRLLECSSSEPVTIDGAAGAIGTEGCDAAAVVSDARGYLIRLYTSSDEAWIADVYDRDWFADVLATVRLDPASALNARERAAGFLVPLSYVVPSGPAFAPGPDYGSSYFELRSPAFAEAGTPSGLIIQAIGGGRADPCDGSSSPDVVPIASGPQAVLDYLRTIPGLDVTGDQATTLGGLPAVQAMVETQPAAVSCSDLHPWASGGPESLPAATVLRLVVVDVDGQHLVLTVYGESTNPAWDVLADRLVESIRFEGQQPAASPTG